VMLELMELNLRSLESQRRTKEHIDVLRLAPLEQSLSKSSSQLKVTVHDGITGECILTLFNVDPHDGITSGCILTLFNVDPHDGITSGCILTLFNVDPHDVITSECILTLFNVDPHDGITSGCILTLFNVDLHDGGCQQWMTLFKIKLPKCQ